MNRGKGCINACTLDIGIPASKLGSIGGKGSKLIFAEFVTWVIGVHEGLYLELCGHEVFTPQSLLNLKFVAFSIFMNTTQGAKPELLSNNAPLGHDVTGLSDTIPLSENELWWTRHFQWFKDRGYLLRPRYTPDWVPSWRGTNKWRYSCEDSVTPLVSNFPTGDSDLIWADSLKTTRWYAPFRWNSCCLQNRETVTKPRRS